MNCHFRDLIKNLLGATMLMVMLTACVPAATPPAEVVVQPPVPTPTLEPTFTPSPSPTNTSTPLPTVTPEPTPTPLPQASLSGRILDQETGQPVVGAKVSVGAETSTTDDAGAYTLTGLAPGQYILSVTHNGYDPGLSAIFTLAEGQEFDLNLALFAPDSSPYPQDPMLTNPLDPNGAPTEKEAERLARLQGLTGQVVSIEETKLAGDFVVNYKRSDVIRAAVAELNHEAWELSDETGHQWWIIKVCGNLASPLPGEAPIATPRPRPLPPLAEVVDRLNLRACAAEGCAEVGTVERGAQVEVFGCLADGGWCEVGWPGGRGWCTGRSLRQLAVAEAVPVVEIVLPTVTSGVVLGGEEKIVFACKIKDCSLSDDGNCLTAVDGSVLFEIKDEICIMNADGSGRTRLTNDRTQDWHPTWSPDGQRIAFARNGDIYLMNADGSNLISFTDYPWFEFEPDWSPDGQQIVFDTEGGKTGIYVINGDGSSLTRLAEGGQHPAWSPDGKRIAFVLDGIFVMNTDGSDQMRLTDEGFWPDWSPDSQRIAFTSLRDGNGEIYSINVDGSDLVRLTEHPEEDVRPAWSPDSQQIVFASNRDGAWSIYAVNADGSGLTRLSDGYDDYAPAWSR